jgi:hypothetical protein
MTVMEIDARQYAAIDTPGLLVIFDGATKLPWWLGDLFNAGDARELGLSGISIAKSSSLFLSSMLAVVLCVVLGELSDSVLGTVR